MQALNVFEYVKQGEVGYQKPITLEDGWNWSMKDHLRRSYLYKNSQFEEQNENRDLRPNKNIILAILNVQYRSEGFDVKDIELYVNSVVEYYKSFLVKKFHDNWALENNIDTFIDETVESYCDYGGTLVRDIMSSRPEVVDLRTIAFCNQTNILAYPFCIKHTFSPSQLRENDMWGKDSNGATIDIESLITLCKDEKEIIVYELIGTLPSEWLDVRVKEEGIMDTQQIQVIAFYKKEGDDRQGVCLFKKRLPKLPFKFLARDEIKGRALGRGGVEELFEEQSWTNWNEIKVTEMLEAASKIIHLSDDPQVASKHPTGLKNLSSNEIIQVGEGKKGVWQMDTSPRTLQLFNNAIDRWYNSAQTKGSAQDSMMGETPNSGTPFKLYEAQIIQSQGMHKYRQGKIAVFMEEIYRDWIIPHAENEIVKDNTFLSELSSEELQKTVDQVTINRTNEAIKERLLSGINVTPEEQAIMMQNGKNAYLKDNKKFIEILKDEFKKKSLSVRANIAGKQKNLAMLTDKLVNVMRQYIDMRSKGVDPTGLDPILNTILESSGMSPIMFSYPNQPVQQQQGQPNNQGLQQLSQINQKNAGTI